MNILCFDISTGGAGAAILDETLKASKMAEIPWNIRLHADGAAVLDSELFIATLEALTRMIIGDFAGRIDAVSFSAFMHNLLLLDSQGRPVGPVFTWMDRRGSDGVERVRTALGPRFHQITGCRYHPMFPVFKLAAMKPAHDIRPVSVKSLAIAAMTGNWIEDHGTASASGLYDVRAGTWSNTMLDLIGLPFDCLPRLVGRNTIAGTVTTDAELRFGLAEGTPVIAGSGDGFLANTGSGCDTAGRMAVTLGTSSSARLVVPAAILDEAAGTFCYRADQDRYLLGCASSNGGNVLNWGRSVFGTRPLVSFERSDLPIFLPLLNGERSPDWNETRTASWHDIRSTHTADDLAAAVLEGVVFVLAHFVDILAGASGCSPAEIVLSGNGFLAPGTAAILASLVDAHVLQPQNQGLASLRGAAVCGFQALQVDVSTALEQIVEKSTTITPPALTTPIRQRYSRFRQLRAEI